jgi:hypothetical protein
MERLPRFALFAGSSNGIKPKKSNLQIQLYHARACDARNCEKKAACAVFCALKIAFWCVP